MVGLVALEELTHFAEKLAGQYLNTHNNERRSYGQTWEQEQRAREAALRLNQGAAQTSMVKDRIDQVSNFAQLLDLLDESDNLAVAPAKFVGLYLALPKGVRDSVIAARDLLDLYYTSDWRRTTVKSADDGAVAYLIDSQNISFKQLPLPSRLVRATGESGGVQLGGGLAERPEFTGHIYPAERFFAVLFGLSEVERAKVFPDPSMLLSLPKPVEFVGLAPAAKEAFAQIGFEIGGSYGSRVVTYPISAAAFDQLISYMAFDQSDTLFNPPPKAESDQGGAL